MNLSRKRVMPTLLIGGLAIAGGVSVVTVSGGSSSDGLSAASHQYCPPQSPGAGQPQGGPENDCGHPNPGNAGNPSAPPEDRPRKPRFRTHRAPKKGCVSRRLAVRYSVSDVPEGGRISVFRDGRKIKTTKRRAFKVRINVRNLEPGIHRLKVRARDSGGNWVARTLRFRRC